MVRARARVGCRPPSVRRLPPAAVGLLLSLLLAPAARAAGPLQLLWPADGAVVTPAWDVDPVAGLQLAVAGLAPPGATVWVNGVAAAVPANLAAAQAAAGALGLQLQATAAGTWQLRGPLGQVEVNPATAALFLAALPVNGPLVEVELAARQGGAISLAGATLYAHLDPQPTYSVTVDDGGDMLADLTRDSLRYASPFAHPVLAWVQRLHQTYGTCFTWFLFEQGLTRPWFHLAQLPARYRQALAAQSSWLRFGLHARAYDPAEPYREATYDQARADLLQVRAEVERFAGPQAWSRCLRTHFWSGSRAACQAWREAGVAGLYSAAPGYRSYYLSDVERDRLTRIDAWRDHAEDMLFLQSDLWLERVYPAAPAGTTQFHQQVIAGLDSVLAVPLAAQNLQIYTHEAFLTEDDHWNIGERLVALLDELAFRGYQPRLDSDDPFLDQLPPVPPMALTARQVGDRVDLHWTHPRPAGLQYRLQRQPLAAPLAAWQEVVVTVSPQASDRPGPGTWVYRVVAVDPAGRVSGGSAWPVTTSGYSSQVDGDAAGASAWPPDLELEPACPNPFNESTVLTYDVAAPATVRLTVFDLAGRPVVHLVDQAVLPGRYPVRWGGGDARGRRLASGVYLVELAAGPVHRGRRVVLAR